MLSHVIDDNRRRVYLSAKSIVEGVKTQDGSQAYVVNDPGKARGGSMRNVRMSQSNIISIIPLSNNATNYTFNVVDNQGANQGNAGILPMEKRLPFQDVLFTYAYGFFLCAFNVGVVGGAPIYPQMHFQLMTFPDPGIGGSGGLNDLAALAGLWTTGHLEYSVGGEVAVPDWWLGPHQQINQTQDKYAFSSPDPYWAQQNASDDGYNPTDPFWIINGGNLNEFIVRYGSDYSQIWANNPLVNQNSGANWNLGLVSVWRGWQAQNVSAIMNAATAK